jgi:hypothetical protein
VNEIFPILAGLIVGGVLGFLRPTTRLAVGAAAAIVLGVLATVVSGEYLISWEYLLIDVPLVALSSVASLVAGRALRRRVDISRAA